jgi:hypothetical protein
MPCRPEIVCWRPRPGCKLSVILIDWRVRESFHSLHYLQRQTLPRGDYEILWLEFYRHKPPRLLDGSRRGRGAAMLIDKWLVAGYPNDCLYHKHRLYNLGVLLAEGKHCVICDSDAIFTPHFLEKTLSALEPPRGADIPVCHAADCGGRQGCLPHEHGRPYSTVVHVDQVRNVRRDLYPFRYPSIEQVLGRGVRNWRGHTTAGLLPEADMIHACNYGACMAAPRQVLIDIGGADEHPGYLGYICGPYEMTFRLRNHGLLERWLPDEFLYHTWHPNASGGNAEYHGPHDGAFVSLPALESRALGRVLPLIENPAIRAARRGQPMDRDELLQALRAEEHPEWTSAGRQSLDEPRIWWIERDREGFNVFYDRGRFHGIRCADGVYDPARKHLYRPLLSAKTAQRVRQLIHYYNRLPRDFWGKFRAEPLYKLPLRLAKKLARHAAALVER